MAEQPRSDGVYGASVSSVPADAQQTDQAVDPQAQAYAQYYAQSYANDPNYAYYYQYFYQQYFIQKAAAEGGQAQPQAQTGDVSQTVQPQPDPAAAAMYYAGYAAPYAYPGMPTPMKRGDEGQGPSRNLWVGGLPLGVHEVEIRAAFEVFGAVENVRMLSTKNVAFVRYYEIENAIRAHDAPPGSILVRGIPVRVQWGKDDPKTQDQPVRNLWVGNVDPTTTEAEIRQLFEPYGQLERIKMVPNKTCAFVTFVSLDSALNAKQHLQGALLKGQPIRINYGRDTSSGREEDMSWAGRRREVPFIRPPEPSDPKLRDVIEKIAAAVSKNALLEDITREKQKNNPLFAFLHEDNEYHKYYRLRIFEIKNPGMRPPQELSGTPPEESAGTSPDQSNIPPWERESRSSSSIPPWEQPAAPPPVQYYTDNFATNDPLTVVDVQQLDDLINHLLPTRESIRNGKDWIMAHTRQAKAVASAIRSRLQQATTFESKLNILHLIHDVLHNAKRKRSSDTDTTPDEIASAFLPHLGPMLNNAYTNQPAEKQAKVSKLLKLWVDQHIFSQQVVNQLEGEMLGNIPAGSSFPLPTQPQTAPSQPQYPPYSAPPQAYAPPQSYAPPQPQYPPPQQYPQQPAYSAQPQTSSYYGQDSSYSTSSSTSSRSGSGPSYNAVPPPSNLSAGTTLISSLDDFLSQTKAKVDSHQSGGGDDDYDRSRKRKRSPSSYQDESSSKRYHSGH